MKKLLTILLLAFSLTLNAQQYEDIVKIQPLSAIVNSYTFELEHKEGKNALLLTIGIPIKGDTKKDWFNAPSRLHTYNLRAAYRRYYKENFGMYCEGYAKFQDFHWTSTLPQGTTNGYIYTTNAGISCGYQYVYKHLVIDFYPVGLEIGRANGRINSVSPTIKDSDGMFNYIMEISNKLPPNARVDLSSDGKLNEGIMKGFAYAWFRSGISIGFKF